MAWQAYAGLAGLQVLSGLQQAEMIRMNSSVQERINEMNAKFAELDAYNATIDTESEIAAYQPMIDQTVGDQRVAFAAQDVDVNFGTAKELQEETKAIGFLNQIKMRQAGRQKAMGFRNEAGNIRLGSAMQSSQAGLNAYGARASGFLSAAATGVSYYSKNGRGYAGGGGDYSSSTESGGRTVSMNYYPSRNGVA